MKKIISMLVLSASFIFAGCSSLPVQNNVTVNDQLWKTKQKIGIFVSPLPKITTGFPGAACLLCYGVASAANSKLSTQVETYKTKQLETTRDSLAALIKAKGADVVVIDALIKESKMPKLKAGSNPHITTDYAVYKKQYGIDQLLVVNFSTVGVLRNYSSYIPTDVPRATVFAQYYMIDTQTNNYTLFNPLSVTRAADGEWDKPPTFPGVTNAFYQVEESAFDQLLASFK